MDDNDKQLNDIMADDDNLLDDIIDINIIQLYC